VQQPTPTTPAVSSPPPPATSSQAPVATGTTPATPAAAAPLRLRAAAVFGGLGADGLAGSFTVNRRAAARVDLLVARTVAVRLRIAGQADGGPRSALVIVGHVVVGQVGPGKVSYRVRLPRAALSALRRSRTAVVTVRLTLRVAGQATQVLTARRHLGP
jgi:hypothetical protein